MKKLTQSRMDYLRQTRRRGYNCATSATGKLGLAEELVTSGHLAGHWSIGALYTQLTDLGLRALLSQEKGNG
jgi:hypothetical protein